MALQLLSLTLKRLRASQVPNQHQRTREECTSDVSYLFSSPILTCVVVCCSFPKSDPSAAPPSTDNTPPCSQKLQPKTDHSPSPPLAKPSVATGVPVPGGEEAKTQEASLAVKDARDPSREEGGLYVD